MGLVHTDSSPRFTGLSKNPNQLGNYLCCLYLPLVISDVLLGNKYLRSTVFSGLIILPVLLTGSVAASVCVSVCFVGLNVLTPRKQVAIMLIVMVCLASLVYYEVDLYEFRVFKVLNAVGESANVEVRVNQYESGLDVFKDYPFFGVGLGQFRLYHEHEMHNTFVSIIIEYGILGSLMIFFLTSIYFLNLFRGIGSRSHLIYGIDFCFLCGLSPKHNLLRERWTWVLLFTLLLITREKKF